MPAAFAAQVGAASHQQHAHGGHGEGNHRVQGDLRHVLDAHLLDHGRQPEIEGIGTAVGAEGQQSQQVDTRIDQGGENGITPVPIVVPVGLAVLAHDLLVQLLLPGREPAGTFGLVAQTEEADHAHQDDRQRLEQEHPLPAGPTIDPAHVLHDQP
ncbi:hypothetical protein D9M71_556740 [compost metagenome]